MEKLILPCGRFIPPAAGEAELRVKLMEGYLAKLTEELEFLMKELDRTLAELKAAAEEKEAAHG